MPDGSFGIRKDIIIDFPYYTFDNDQYCEFMMYLMNSLEYRQFPNKYVIAYELDECTEILFIEQGRYNIGYDINKKIYFRKQLGALSIIGGYQLMNTLRFEFIYQACTVVKAQAIRKKKFHELIKQWPKFKNAMNIKFWRQYGHIVYLPLIKRKNIDIRDQTFRADFSSVMYLK